MKIDEKIDKYLDEAVKVSAKDMPLFKTEHPNIKKQAQRIISKLIKKKGKLTDTDLWDASVNFDNSMFSDGFTKKFIEKIYKTYKSITGNEVVRKVYMNTLIDKIEKL